MNVLCVYMLFPVGRTDVAQIRVGVQGNWFVSMEAGRILCPSTVRGKTVCIGGVVYQVN